MAGNHTEYITREKSIELLNVVCRLCEKLNVDYSLSDMSVWSADVLGEFAEYGYTCSLMLLYNDYEKLYQKCIEMYGRKRAEIYVIDAQNCEEYYQYGFRLAKKSSVELRPVQKKDENYYDYFISVIPIYYAGNTLCEYNKLVKYYKEIQFRLNVKDPIPYTFKLKRAFSYIKRKYYSKRYSPVLYQELKERLELHKVETKYVFLPSECKQKKSSKILETYKHTKEVEYCGIKTRILENPQKWLSDFYGKKRLEKLKNRPKNEASLRGPEILREVQQAGLESLVEFDRICRKYDIKYTITLGTLLGAIRHGGFIPWDDDIDVALHYDEYKKFEKVARTELDTDKFFLQNQATDKDTNLVFPTLRRNNTVYQKPGREHFNTHRGISVDLLVLFDDAPTYVQRRIQDKICKFYKTLTWAHMESAKLKGIKWRLSYYIVDKKGGNKYTYAKFLKWANRYNQGENKVSDKLTYLLAGRNPYNNVFTNRKTYEDLVDVEFEGHMVKMSKDYAKVLHYLYGRDYLRFPQMSSRFAKHMPGHIKVLSKENKGEEKCEK